MIYIQIHLGQCDLYYNGLMIKMLQYKMYPAGELAVLRQLLFFVCVSALVLDPFLLNCMSEDLLRRNILQDNFLISL